MGAKQSRMLEQAPVTAPSSPPDVAASVPASPPVPGAAPAPAQLADATPQADGAFRIPGLDVSGDVRVRQEWNFVPGRDRSRSAVRARLRASYAIDDHFSVGTQIATGDPDDPNSTDEIGRASCRERECQYVSTPGVSVTIKKKKKK